MSIYQTFKKMQSGPVMIGIAVFGILTFTITFAVNQTFAPDPRKAKNTTVTLPSGKTMGFSENDRSLAQSAFNLFIDSSGRNSLFMMALQSRNPALRKLGMQSMSLIPWTARHMGASGEMKKKQSNNEVEQIMLVNAIARDRGLDVATAELKDWLDKSFESPEQYKQLCQSLNVTYPQFQAILREAMLYKRAMEMLLAQTPLPSGDELVKEWCERNERFTFDVVTFSAEAKKKTIDEKAITNEELKKWFDEQNEFDKKKYEEPDKFQVEGLAVLNESLGLTGKLNDAFETLVKTIEVQDIDVQNYFSMARVERYKKPAPESKPASAPGTETMPESGPSSQPVVEFYNLDEKKLEAAREVRIARALEKVKAEAIEAATKPNFDVKAFAEKYGLTYWASGEPTTLVELRTIPVHGCIGLISGVSDVKDGEFLSGYQPAPGAIQVSRLVRKVPARIPEVPDLRDELVPDYLDKRSFTLAKEDATKFRDAVEDAKVEAGQDALNKIAKEMNLDVKRLAPIAKSVRENNEVDYAEVTKDVSQYLGSLRNSGPQDPFLLKKDALSRLLESEQGKAIYVARCVDRQVPTMADMGPSDYSRFKENQLVFLRERKCLELISSTALEKTLKIERKTGATQ